MSDKKYLVTSTVYVYINNQNVSRFSSFLLFNGKNKNYIYSL